MLEREAIIKPRVTFTFFGVTLESSGTDCVVIEVQSGLGVPQLKLQQRLMPPEVKAEGSTARQGVPKKVHDRIF